jgi:hypothetical protein
MYSGSRALLAEGRIVIITGKQSGASDTKPPAIRRHFSQTITALTQIGQFGKIFLPVCNAGELQWKRQTQ